jgi:outer membrane protein OmpA-like peptidoglycan-associated protein/ABC-type nitrate/sulfonate/bicarbonate transport system substrate-binding protein
MNGKVIGALAVFAVGLAVVLGIYFLTPWWKDSQQRAASDARGTSMTIAIGVDDWIGYAPLCSLEMKRLEKNAGRNTVCKDDKANYAQRMEQLQNGELQFAVATVDTDVLNGAPKNFPGVEIAVIDESKGGDAILCYKDKYANLNALKGHSDLKIAYTPNSPSHHLLKVTADHFGIPELIVKGANRIETDGSEAAMKVLLSKKVDCAVLWEPNVSKALNKGSGAIINILGTEKTKRVIVDVLLVDRKFANKDPEVVTQLLGNYFLALKMYRDKPDLLKSEIISAHRLSSDEADAMLRGVAWATLNDNAFEWLGVNANGTKGDNGLVATIESTWRTLVASGDFSTNPLPAQDPYRLVNNSFVTSLITKGMSGFTTLGVHEQNVQAPLSEKFGELTLAQWQGLKEVGSLKIEPITFQSGSDVLTDDGKAQLESLAEKLKHYPTFRIIVRGHTGLTGDPAANKELSQDRADAISRYFQVTYSVDPNRVRTIGMGSESLLPLLSGETKDDRSYEYRLPRVEITLANEVF